MAERFDVKGFLDEIEEAIEAVRHAYEKYFSGVDRVPPVRQREKLQRRLRQLETMGLRTTALRFRAGGLRARFVTYKHYWTRVEHELERGASRRDLLKLRRGAPAPAPKAPQPEPEPEPEAAPQLETTEGPIQPLAPPLPMVKPRPGSVLPPPPPTGALKGTKKVAAPIDPTHLRDVFKQLVKAKKAVGRAPTG